MVEDIEILRFFDLNIKIKMIKLNSNSIAVDEKNDVKKVEKFLKKMTKIDKKFIDPLIKRKKNISNKVQYYNNIPIPSIIEISESGTCNRKCSFCPRSAPEYKDVKEFIPAGLIEKIAKELSESIHTKV